MTLSIDDEGLAAEYALGTLDAGERAAAAARRPREAKLDAAISEWEARLSPLLEDAADLAAPDSVWSRIESALGQPPAAVDFAARKEASLQSRVARWRATAGGAGALAAGLAAALAFVVVSRPTAPHQFVAILQKSADAPAFAMTVDIDKLSFTVRPVAAEAPADKSYQLWLIAPQQAPKSLGIIDAGAVTPGRSLAGDPAQVREATYAVTVEPRGGSPTGQPTSAPVFFGKLVPVGP